MYTHYRTRAWPPRKLAGGEVRPEEASRSYNTTLRTETPASWPSWPPERSHRRKARHSPRGTTQDRQGHPIASSPSWSHESPTYQRVCPRHWSRVRRIPVPASQRGNVVTWRGASGHNQSTPPLPCRNDAPSACRFSEDPDTFTEDFSGLTLTFDLTWRDPWVIALTLCRNLGACAAGPERRPAQAPSTASSPHAPTGDGGWTTDAPQVGPLAWAARPSPRGPPGPVPLGGREGACHQASARRHEEGNPALFRSRAAEGLQRSTDAPRPSGRVLDPGAAA